MASAVPLAGTALAIFAFVYFLLDGPHLAHSVSGIIPRRSRPRVMTAAQSGWTAMVSYVRAAVTVAAQTYETMAVHPLCAAVMTRGRERRGMMPETECAR